REVLIRRATLDLLGLPPTPEEVRAFVNDPSPDAYERLTDRLLASPHYGERWGRHWLDVVRYADSGGFETDIFFSHAWRYRDYVPVSQRDYYALQGLFAASDQFDIKGDGTRTNGGGKLAVKTTLPLFEIEQIKERARRTQDPAARKKYLQQVADYYLGKGKD